MTKIPGMKPYDHKNGMLGDKNELFLEDQSFYRAAWKKVHSCTSYTVQPQACTYLQVLMQSARNIIHDIHIHSAVLLDETINKIHSIGQPEIQGMYV